MGEPQASENGEFLETTETMLAFLTQKNIPYSLASHPAAPTSEEHLVFLKDYLESNCNGFAHEGAKLSIIKNMFLKDKRRGNLLRLYYFYFVFNNF